MFARRLLQSAIGASAGIYTVSHCDRITNALDNFKNFCGIKNPLLCELNIEKSYDITNIDHFDKYGNIRYNYYYKTARYEYDGEYDVDWDNTYILYIRNTQDLINAITLDSKNNKLIACYDENAFDIKSDIERLSAIYDINIKDKLRLISVKDLEKLYKIECIKRE
jgi:hypothetical protein